MSTIKIDGNPVGELDLQENGWQSARLKGDREIYLDSGHHSIEFLTPMPYYPAIDAVKLSTSLEKNHFDMSEYNEFISVLKDGMEGPKIKEKSEQFSFEKFNESITRSASNATDDWTVSSYTLDNPLGTYEHLMTVPVTYTFYRKIYLNALTSVTFETQIKAPWLCTAVDPVMYLFNENDHNLAWSNDDGGCDLQSKLSVYIPASGNYYLVIRAYSSYYSSTTQGYQGLVNVLQNGSLIQEDAVVGGYTADVTTSNTGTLNYFTGYSTGLPMIWIAPGGSGATAPMKFLGERYWYSAPMSYTWDTDARVRFNKNSSGSMNTRMLVSSEGAWYVYWGNADIYGAVKQASSSVVNAFPNLYTNDAMQTAPINVNYNCSAWAGGKTDAWVWHCLNNPNNPICASSGNPNYWNSWADYFGNNPLRYSGATTYTTSQSNANNAEIAAWSTNGSFSGITHFSVRAEANQHPHGYDWESKPGELERIFHPKNALSGTGYGNIFTYYRDANKSPGIDYTRSRPDNLLAIKKYSFEESVALGLTTVIDVKLDEAERNILSAMEENQSTDDFNHFLGLFENWMIGCDKNYPKTNSNLYAFFEDPAYKELSDFYDQSIENILPFYIDSLFHLTENNFTSQLFTYAFCSLNKDIHGSLLVEAKEEWRKDSYTKSGSYIAPTPEYITRQYARKILQNTGSIIKIRDITIIENSTDIFQTNPNPVQQGDEIKIILDLESGHKVEVLILDIRGTIIKELAKGIFSPNNTVKEFSFSTALLQPGVYICRARIDGQILSRKFLVH